MQEGKRPAAVGFYFSLGHSTVVWAGTIAIALTAAALEDNIEAFKAVGGVAGTLVSASSACYRGHEYLRPGGRIKTFQRVEAGGAYVEEDLNMLLATGPLARISGRCFARFPRLAHVPLGLLFGLGFDTASEIGLLGLSAASAPTQGMSLWSILVFPALFTAGMSLVDTTDGVLMLRAYGWAFVKPSAQL